MKQCQMCKVQVPDKYTHPFCSKCEWKLTRDGKCKWCAEADVTAPARLCSACKQVAKEKSEEMRQYVGGRAYRPSEAREDRYETKYGRD